MDNVTKTLMRRRGLLLAGAALTLAAAGTGWAAGRQGAAAPVLPDPVQENSAAATAVSETAVLAGGCFWGVQGVFQHLEGVSAAVSGYAGGEANTANYRRVSGGASDHAEAVRVTFDPRVVSFGRILQVFFSVAHDPTQLNRQGPDVGTQYRSAIFPQSPEQARVARAYIAQLNAARIFDAAIVTRLEADRPFYPAEDYHQDYMTRNPTQPYIAIHDLPKIGELRRVFPDRFRAAPILVSAR